MNAEKEEWRAVVGYEGFYEVSSFGRVRSLTRTKMCGRHNSPDTPRTYKGRLLAGGVHSAGYPQYALSGDGPRVKLKMFQVHELVAAAFIGPRPVDMCVAHNDGDPSNNRPENLRYATYQSNSDDMFIHGTRQYGDCHPNHKLTEKSVKGIYQSGDSFAELARTHHVSERLIWNIKHGLAWRRVTDSLVASS